MAQTLSVSLSVCLSLSLSLIYIYIYIYIYSLKNIFVPKHCFLSRFGGGKRV